MRFWSEPEYIAIWWNPISWWRRLGTNWHVMRDEGSRSVCCYVYETYATKRKAQKAMKAAEANEPH